jgi:nicotinate-nucleotide pyrophosphorylase (carboxylating)
LRWALLEDLAPAGDVTSQALAPKGKKVQGVVLAKADGVISGVQLLEPLLRITGELLGERRRKSPCSVTIIKSDGARVLKGEVVAKVEASAKVLLAAERTALNLLCHLSGIATQTALYVARVAHTKAKIIDTRKTTPLWRDLEKFAVRCGGGENHRYGLHDMILVKDNHLALWGLQNPAGAVKAAQKKFPRLPCEVEVVDLAGLKRVCREAAPEFVLLDNFSLAALQAAARWRNKYYPGKRKKKFPGPQLEASGRVTLETVAAVAETGVERISIGALTHSAKALDLSLELKAF